MLSPRNMRPKKVNACAKVLQISIKNDIVNYPIISLETINAKKFHNPVQLLCCVWKDVLFVFSVVKVKNKLKLINKSKFSIKSVFGVELSIICNIYFTHCGKWLRFICIIAIEKIGGTATLPLCPYLPQFCGDIHLFFKHHLSILIIKANII